MSLKVQPGGMFNSYKVRYSPETHNMLRVLMDEVRLTTAQRAQLKESLKKGKPLPMLPSRKPRPSYVEENLFDMKKNFYFSKRSQEQIMHSGAYDRDRYRFLERVIDLENEKERLRSIMEFGKERKKGKVLSQNQEKEKKKEKESEISPEERIAELMFEVEDRLEFLKEMEKLGQAKKYEATLRQEIAAKLREMKQLDKNAADQFSRFLGLPKKPKTNVEQILFDTN